MDLRINGLRISVLRIGGLWIGGLWIGGFIDKGVSNNIIRQSVNSTIR